MKMRYVSHIEWSTMVQQQNSTAQIAELHQIDINRTSATISKQGSPFPGRGRLGRMTSQGLSHYTHFISSYRDSHYEYKMKPDFGPSLFLFLIKSLPSGLTFPFVCVTASATANTFASHIKTVCDKPYMFGTINI